MNFKLWLENSISSWETSISTRYPEADVEVWQTSNHIELANLKIPLEQQGSGIGTEIVQSLQIVARELG